ncbi:M24 family metallopeptidase [Parvularcula oceani]|uniref:M24 family metallopeptidase n=1 Tax=Parvularcula oceani TaxID=1247963 RepID=UPI0004E1F2F5|nr:M24 family metallopeptidase [Parvularcula oceani]
MTKTALISALLCGIAAAPALAAAQSGYEPAQGEASMSPPAPEVLSPREQARIEDEWLGERLDTVVPELMRRNGIDMWILVAREYMEDPVVSTMLNATSLRARRRTILVFHDQGEEEGVERLTVSRYDLGDFFKSAWNPEEGADQWERLAEIVAERDPDKIALNTSSLSAFGDGMTYSQYTDLVDALPDEYRDRVVEGYPLAIGWLETRIPAEIDRYDDIVRTAHNIIGQGFSAEVIEPGETTVDDVVWWFRQKIADMGLVPWFHPSVAIYREGVEGDLRGDAVIGRGDMLWTDFGIVYLGLNTDTQHLGYVLKEGETEAPEGLQAGLRAANAVQDDLTSSFEVGLSGNEVLAAARQKALSADLDPSIYSHPIGFHGHGAGTSIGFWDNQDADPRGAYPVMPNTAWSIELKATHAVPEWGGQRVDFKTEEDAYFDGDTVTYLDGRQTQFHLIDAD